MARPFAVILILFGGIGLYGVGYWHGQSTLEGAQGVVQIESKGVHSVINPASGGGSDASVSSLRGSEPGGPAGLPTADLPTEMLTREQFEALVQAKAWFKLERWLATNQRQIQPAHGQQLHSAISADLNKYDALSMRRVLRVYLQAQPNDTLVLFLLSDLNQMSGLPETALDSLFKILEYPNNDEDRQRAQREIDQIASMIDAGYANRGAHAERAAFWQHLSERAPANDYFRYRWASALVELRQYAQARRLLAETGTVGVVQADLDNLGIRIERAEGGVEFQRDGDRMLATAYTGSGQSLTLLVDTGANVTSLNRRVLRTMAAHKQPERVLIRTANGVVETSVYRVDSLEVSGRQFENITVMELPVELPGIDGLLGLDLVDKLTTDPFSSGSR